jgi:hypothetical protein
MQVLMMPFSMNAMKLALPFSNFWQRETTCIAAYLCLNISQIRLLQIQLYIELIDV